MTVRLSYQAGCAVAGLALVVASCGGGPVAPRAPAAPPASSQPGPAPAPTGTVGLHTLTITSRDTSAPCLRVPEALRRRVYTADVEQTGSDLKVSLSGATFVSNVFEGVITPDREVYFTIRPVQPWDYDAFDVVERLSDGTLLLVSGTISARRTTEGIFGEGGEIRPAHTASDWCRIDDFDLVPASGDWDY